MQRDRNSILKIEIDRFDDPMNGMLLNYLVNKYGLEFFFVIDISGNGTPDAYLFAGKESTKTIQIISIAIFKKYEASGWGRKLMESLFSKAKESNFHNIELHVDKTNFRAIALYEKFGFKQIGIAPSYYGPKRDAFIMMAEM